MSFYAPKLFKTHYKLNYAFGVFNVLLMDFSHRGGHILRI